VSYLRQPTIAGDTVAFICSDDVWSVATDGGRASRLTAGVAEASRPRLSANGEIIAFTSNDEAAPEIWCVPVVGGEARRISWFGAPTTGTMGWAPDGRVLAFSIAAQPFFRWTQPWAIDAITGAAEQLPIGPITAISHEPGGSGVVITRNSTDPARWKRYRGGTAGQIWVDRRGDGAFRRILADNPADLAAAMWVGGRLYFLSDHEGVGNLYSVRPNGSDLRRHTDHNTYYARTATTDGERIVYAHAADLWMFDPADDSSRPLEVQVGAGSAHRRRRFVKPMESLTGFGLHPRGSSALLETRGQVVDLPLWERAPRAVAPVDGVRQRLAAFLPDGDTVVSLSDATGEERLTVHPADGEPRPIPSDDLGDVWELAPAPAGDNRVAVTNQRHELIVVDLDSGASRLLDTAAGGELTGLAWSPDGRWLAYSAARNRRTRSIALCDTGSGQIVEVTKAEFGDHAPAWDPGGRFLYYLSRRILDPVVDELFFDLNFPRTVKVFVVPLQAGDRSPFVADARPMRDQPGKPGAEAAAGPAAVVVDADGIDRRSVPLPMPTGRYLTVLPLADSVLVLSAEVEGELDRDIFAPKQPSHTLLKVDIPSGKIEPLITDVAAVALSADGSTVLYRSQDRLRALPAGVKPSDDAGDEPSRASGWLDIDRVKVAVDPPSEWRQMFAETWRLQRDLFWDPEMSGIDWELIRRRYAPLVDRLGARSDLSDLIWELQGELGTSHAYEVGGDRRRPQPWGVGFLGADLGVDGRGRWRIDRIVRADSWDPAAGSPLEAPGVDVREGDVILEVDRRPVNADRPVAAELVNKAGATVELTLVDARGRRRRHVVVTTLRDEGPLRYRAWVEERRRAVHEATDGTVGYVHIPDMGTVGYAEFHRSYLSEFERGGLIVDVRDNRGGFVSQLLLEKLGRKRIGYDVSRHQPPSPYPEDSPAGPLVCLTNENAGSDGDIFSHCFKLMGLGPLVGTRTWGGVIGINGRHRLVDGTITTQPEYSFWFNDVGWGVENYGTDPDVVVDKTPRDWAAGDDPQLDRGLALMRQAMRRHKPPTPTTARPQLTLPALPPR
jgi:tricorn protease